MGRVSQQREHDYRASLLDPAKAQRYERVRYGGPSHDNWLWGLEQQYLTDVVDRHLVGRPIRYLDFACGTGRILAFLESRVAESTGVDISANMLELARPKLRRSELIVGDPTTDPFLVPGPYDLITSFRFFLNAQDELRSAALRVLHGALADDGLLVLNIHGNRWSLRLPSVLFHRYVLRETKPIRVNQLSYWKMRRLLRRHGFEVVELRGYGFLPRRLQRLLGRRTGMALERLGTRSPTRYLAVSLLLVCRKSTPAA
jgi:SAM-dependent methyltransferase